MLLGDGKANQAFWVSCIVIVCAVSGWLMGCSPAHNSLGGVRNRTQQGQSTVKGDALVASARSSATTGQNIAKRNLAKETNANASTVNFAVSIRKPTGPPRVELGVLDMAGNAVTAACSTCHTTRPADYANRRPADLIEFHRAMTFAHGKVSCLSCHNPDDYDTLRLADGSKVEYTEVMTLCAQCHGPQTRDYEHGAHGGMNGYWDLSRGPRTRNNCIDCHDPHAPGFPAMKPTFKPRDRFLNSDDNTKASSHD